ncbi:S-layer homology domain-containing protein [Citricoccus nitrophenolicus]
MQRKLPAAALAGLMTIGFLATPATATTTPEPAGTTQPGAECTAANFADNQAGSQYFDYVRWMQCSGITTGYADNTYRKGADIDRGESMAFVYRYLNADFTPGEATFPDAPAGSTHFEAIEWGAAEEITTGYADGTFQPHRPVERGEFASFLYRALDPTTDPETDVSFPDVAESNTHHDAIIWLASEDISTGYKDGTFKAKDPITRGEVAALMSRLDGVINPDNPEEPEVPQEEFDLQAHRGGQGLYTESTRESFAHALELGVTTLELDTQVTADGAVVVTHDRKITTGDCRDTAPAMPEDPQYPYVGKYITDLTLDQVQTLECGYQQDPKYPGQAVATGPMMELDELFEVVREYGADEVMLNIETKVEAGAPEETAPRETFVRAVLAEILKHGMEDQVMIQSFDWGALELVEELAPTLPRSALTNGDFLQVGQPGASPWLGGLDADDFDGDLVAMAQELGVEVISPVHGNPQDGAIGDEGYAPYVNQTMVDDAHAAGIDVVPWTVDDPGTMEYLMDLGVDGIITDYPDRLRQVMQDRGLDLPQAAG